MDVDLVTAESRTLPTAARGSRTALAAVRIVLGLFWITNVVWKTPPDFATLRHFTGYAVRYPVLGPYSFVVEHVVLPNFTVFGYLVMVTEASLGAFLLLGLATRFWALVGMAQSAAITLSVINAPHEWSWAYYLMITCHAAIWATAAGRVFGLDGVLRSGWVRSSNRALRLLGTVS